MSSVVGIDFGNLNTVVAVARNRGIDVITNETSNRATPSLVSLTDKQRGMGESARTLEISNFKNTVGSLKRLVGRVFSDPEINKFEKKFINARLTEVDGQAGVSVSYMGEEKEFTFIQLCVMFFGKVKQFTSHEIGVPLTDCVISCPTWFTDAQRRALLDAASISGLTCLRLMNDTTAIALGYGITKTDLPDPADEKHKPRIVVFCDMGQSAFQVAIASFVKGKLTIMGTACDRNLGGRDFDEALTQHYIDEFDKKYKMDIRSNAKAIFRMRSGAEKVKKILSANAQAPFNIECLLDDKDVSALVERSHFEEMVQSLVSRINGPLEVALSQAGISKDQVDFVELVGGSTRVPIVKETLAKFFGKTVDGLSFTLNQDEAVARGCAFQCAILSPALKVREFTVVDQNTHSITLVWDAAQLPDTKKGEQLVTSMEAFTANNQVPSTKKLTFYRALRNKELKNAPTVDFTLRAEYTPGQDLPSGTSTVIGEYTIKGIQKLPSIIAKEGETARATIEVKAKLDGNGLVYLENAEQTEVVTVSAEEAKEAEKSENQAEGGTPTEPVTADAKESKKEKTKKITKRHPLKIEAKTAGSAPEVIQKWMALEGEMAASDRLIIDTAEKRNTLEEYVYETRSKLTSSWEEFIQKSDADSFISKLNETEDWLYGDGEEAAKSVYVDRLNELKKIGDPVYQRYIQAEERPMVEKEFRESVNAFLLDLEAEDERYSHIQKEELEATAKACRQKLDWLNEVIAKQNETPKHAPLVISCEKIRQELAGLKGVVTKVTSKPKPKPAAPPKEEPKAEKEDVPMQDNTQNSSTTAADQPMEEDGPKIEEVDEKQMDLD